jgi:hypothetical protein
MHKFASVAETPQQACSLERLDAEMCRCPSSGLPATFAPF